MATEAKRKPIVEGDQFKASSGQVYLVTEAMGFGRGYWVITLPCRTRQTIFNRYNLELMQRVDRSAG